jgi:hypothetical protein
MGKEQMNETASARLFELEPTNDCELCESLSLRPGWRELVSDVGFCDSCGGVVWILPLSDRARE